MVYKMAGMNPQIKNASELIERLEKHQIGFITHQKNQEGIDSLYVTARLKSSERCWAEIGISG